MHRSRPDARVIALLLSLACLAMPAAADVAVTVSDFPDNLDLSVDGTRLVERVGLEIQPAGAVVPAACAWTLPERSAATGARVSVRCDAGDVAGVVSFEQVAPGVVSVALDLDDETPMPGEGGVRLTAVLAGFERGTVLARSEPWWLRPVFVTQQNFIPNESQLVLAQRRGDYAVVLPLAAGGAGAWARGVNVPITSGGVQVSLDAFAPWSVRHAPLAVLAQGGSPYALVADAFRAGLDAMGKPGRLRVDKPYPETLTRFGFCSWNSFYDEQTSENLMGAARAFRAADFPIGLMIIDAGWQSASQDGIFTRRLTALEADPVKIPGGLKALVAAMKAASGARWIGAWHSLQGVPGGVDPGSTLARAQADNLWEGNHGALLPDPTSERGAAFFRASFDYLKDAGIDLVKVDFQNWHEFFLRGRLPVFSGVQRSVYNMHAAAKERFGDAVINCMSMGSNALFNLRDTNVVRNSLDYLLPPGPLGHRRHVINNIFNSVATQQVAWPDFDMWEAYGDFASYHAVLRALSGGPVYVTGEVAKQDWELLRRFVLSDGTLLRTDVPVAPTRDALFVDAGHVPVPLKGFTRVGSTGIVGAFNVLESGGAVSGALRPSDVEDLAGERFAVLEHFSRALHVVGRDEEVPIALDADEARLYWIAPIEHEAAAFGLVDKFVAPRTLLAHEDDGARLRLRVAEGGTLGVYLEKQPESVRVDGAPVAGEWHDGLLLVGLDGSVAGERSIEIMR